MANTRSITVELGERSYPIVIGSGLLGGGYDLTTHIRGADCLIVTNETVAPLYLQAVIEDLGDKQIHAIELPDGEKYKTLETVGDILDTLVEREANRDTTLVALGGGVVGDITGFSGGLGYNFGNFAVDVSYSRSEHDRNQQLYTIGLTDSAAITRVTNSILLTIGFSM